MRRWVVWATIGLSVWLTACGATNVQEALTELNTTTLKGATRNAGTVDDGFTSRAAPARSTATSRPGSTATPKPSTTATPMTPTSTATPAQTQIVVSTPGPTLAPTATLDPDLEPVRTDFFVDQEWRTSSADVAVDANGGVHIAGYYYQSVVSGPTSAFYRYCPANCDDPNQWHEVKLLDHVNEVQVEVTSAGQPRLLIRTERDNLDGYEYYYAECNRNCLTPSGWRVVEVQKGGSTYLYEIQDDSQPQRSFALDPQGRPRFLYIDRNYSVEPDRYGTYYKYCDTDCLKVENWGEVVVGPFESAYAYEMFEYPSLVFTSQGQPRVLAAYIANGQAESLLHYLQCDAGCEDVANWDRVDLWPRGQGPEPGWDIALDKQDRPRIAFYPESMEDGSGDQLTYGLCNADCTNPASWQRANMNLGVDTGGDPDIVFDPDGFPRIVYVASSGAGMGLAECTDKCDSVTDAVWATILLDSDVELDNDWPIPVAPICDGGLWNILTPSIAYDAKGDVRIVTDVTYHGRCWWDTDYNEWKESYQFSLIQRSVRGIFIDWR